MKVPFTWRPTGWTTPVDDGTSDMFSSIWWPRDAGDEGDRPPERHQQQANKQFLSTLWADLEIWRYQVYVETPAFAKQDAKPYVAIRKWARQFNELDPV